MEEHLWWIALYLVPGIGTKLFKRLIDHFGSPREIFNASIKDLEMVKGISREIANKIKSFDMSKVLKKELELMKKSDIKVVTLKDKEYPKNLRSIFDPPPLLYVKGELRKEDEFSIAIVGTRAPTRYGKLTAEKLSWELGSYGLTVVSGMAKGIDSFAHEGVISGGGRSLAVFGSGLDVVYPPENKKLMYKIIDNGAIISEFPMQTKPNRENFPIRNRIISGISLGTVVVEAASRSGSLITAQLALEQGREVFAVPGNINSGKSKGTNSLLKLGAKLVEGIDDIIEELEPQIGICREKKVENQNHTVKRSKSDKLGEEEEKICSLIGDEGKHIDSIIIESSLPSSKVASILSKLELMGFIKQYSGKIFFRKN